MMSKVISVLEKMASDASLVSKENIDTLLTIAVINAEQQQAITAKDAEHLAETITDLPKIRAFAPVFPAEDDDQGENDDQGEDENTETGALLATVASF